MSLSVSTLRSLIDTNLANEGATGYNRFIFSEAIANGIIMSIASKTFTTSDTGLVPGTGTGNGTGITSLSSSNMTSTTLALFPTTGVNAERLVRAIMQAVVTHLTTSATLTSSHTPVYSGTGIINIGSITVSTIEMTTNIDNQLFLIGANGYNRTILSSAIATGIVTEIIGFGTGTVIITGTPSGIPTSGSGSGTGVIN